MKRFILFLAAALMVSTVLAGFKYEGEWGKLGTGKGQFRNLYAVDVSTDTNVYVADEGNKRIQYFTPTGSYVGEWRTPGVFVAIAPNGNAYTATGYDYYYYTKSGSLLGSWSIHPWDGVIGPGDIAPNGNYYSPEQYSMGNCRVSYYSPTGSRIGFWDLDPFFASGVGVAPNSNVYVAEKEGVGYRHRISWYTPTGSLLGSWGSSGSGNGQFRGNPDVDVAPDGRVFVADTGNDRVQYFAPTGSFLGKWGTRGTGAGEFNEPKAIAVSPDGKRVYVADAGNNRIQYFVEATVTTPASLGRVKALFK